MAYSLHGITASISEVHIFNKYLPVKAGKRMMAFCQLAKKGNSLLV